MDGKTKSSHLIYTPERGFTSKCNWLRWYYNLPHSNSKIAPLCAWRKLVLTKSWKRTHMHSNALAVPLPNCMTRTPSMSTTYLVITGYRHRSSVRLMSTDLCKWQIDCSFRICERNGPVNASCNDRTWWICCRSLEAQFDPHILWQTIFKKHPRPEFASAPTWSWASVEGEIDYRLEYNVGQLQIWAHVAAVEMNYVSRRPFGGRRKSWIALIWVLTYLTLESSLVVGEPKIKILPIP